MWCKLWKGTYTYDSGSIYFGDFESGIKKGKGTYKRFDGFIYEGYWDNDLANGFGKITYKNCVIESVWKDGKIVEEPNFLVGKEGIFDNKDLNFETESFKLDADKYTHLEYNKMLEENKEFNSSESCSNPSFLRESLYWIFLNIYYLYNKFYFVKFNFLVNLFNIIEIYGDWGLGI